ncbi:MAG: hypothetical protein J6P61_07655 [Erysipelotrichaceae bacterium]|nr:hypothetical protein [Erysipelotrichaceae bacterium]
MKRSFIIGLVMLLIVTGCTQKTFIESGQCGKNARWQVDNDGTLRISGTGLITKEFLVMADEYDRLNSVIKRLVIEEGITGISEEASFSNIEHLEEIILPDTFEGKIGIDFSGDPYLRHIRIGKSMKQTTSEYMEDCEHLETIENASDYEIPLRTDQGKRTWYVDNKKTKKCPPHKTAHAVGNIFHLTYDFNGGQIINEPDTHQYGQDTPVNQPFKEGSHFMGWYGYYEDYDMTLSFFDTISGFWGQDFHLKAMYADYKLEAIDGGFRVVMANTKDFKAYEEMIVFRYADNEAMKKPQWGNLVAPMGKGKVTGLKKGKTYYVEICALDYEWWSDADPEDDVKYDEKFHGKQSITIN